MKPPPLGRSIEDDPIRFEALRNMTAAEKVAVVCRLNQEARHRRWDAERRKHPTAPDEELKLRLFSYWIPRDLKVRAFSWNPVEHGWEPADGCEL